MGGGSEGQKINWLAPSNIFRKEGGGGGGGGGGVLLFWGLCAYSDEYGTYLGQHKAGL